MDALTLALSRTYLSITLVKAGAVVPVARCGADRLVRAFTIAELNNPKVDRSRVRRRSRRAASRPERTTGPTNFP